MKVTSAQANKMLRNLKAELEMTLQQEKQRAIFNAAVGEKLEDVRPEYSFIETQKKILWFNNKIRKLKHAISVFNTTTKIPDFGYTIDEALVIIPQLTQQVKKLSRMSTRLPRERVDSGLRSSIIDYTIANYNIEDATAEYNKRFKELSDLQTALDVVNNTVEFEVE